MRVAVNEKSALLVIDAQRDFMPGGSVPVPRGAEILRPLNELLRAFSALDRPIIATRDWHPGDHISFAPKGPWPPHCVQGSEGAEFHRDLALPPTAVVVSKGTNPEKEAYSGFEGTDLERELRDRGVRRLFVGGVATEYCVRATVLDALDLGFEVFLLEDAVMGIEPDTSRRSIEEMVRAGTVLIRSKDII